jgi:hypothetical protein
MVVMVRDDATDALHVVDSSRILTVTFYDGFEDADVVIDGGTVVNVTFDSGIDAAVAMALGGGDCHEDVSKLREATREAVERGLRE